MQSEGLQVIAEPEVHYSSGEVLCGVYGAGNTTLSFTAVRKVSL